MRRLYQLTVFSSAFLLFMVQPMLAKVLLPKVGGAPAVWIVAMLFFQVMLLAGYAYAAYGSTLLSPRWQSRLHVSIMAVATACFLPLSVPTQFDLTQQAPEMLLLGTLAMAVGLPYFMLAAHNTLLQRWYFDRFNEVPYPLFAISNAGSFAGLLGYPFVMEWLLPLSQQMQVWSIGFCVLFVLICIISWPRPAGHSTAPVSTAPLGWRRIGMIVLLGFIPSSLFLSTTLHVTSDIASFPLLWVVPLALYLLSFVIVFSAFGERALVWARTLHPLAVVGMTLGSLYSQYTAMLGLSFVFFFVVAISCHGTLARYKPEPARLGAYYLWLSVGGALGGVLGVLAPHLFTDVFEYYLVAALSLVALKGTGYLALSKRSWVLVALVIAATIWQVRATTQEAKTIHESRNFFGISRVKEAKDRRWYKHGTTLHGTQSLQADQALAIQSYYAPLTQLLSVLPAAMHTKPFGIVGLGIGTTACLGIRGQEVDFFEIDPAVIAIASNADWFTYLRDCPATLRIIEGDGRLSLTHEPDGRYNLLVMDAFTSDAVPVHLLTHEAITLYIRTLDTKHGVLAIHISNRHLALAPFVVAAIRQHGWVPYHLLAAADADNPLSNPSEWVFALPPDSPNQRFLPRIGLHPTDMTGHVWSDDYSNLLEALKR